MKKLLAITLISFTTMVAMKAQATFVDLGSCGGDAVDCLITGAPPNPVSQNPNDGILLAWNEVQNFTLTQDLRVDRVFDENASFVEKVGSDFLIKAGTIVSSHYLQWDPVGTTTGSVNTTITLDSQVFAFITADQNLFDSDFLGLPGLDYNDFGLRGLESGDTTNFNGGSVDINWTASSPGDWTRLITAFSPGGVTPIPLPATVWLLVAALAGVGVIRRSNK